SGKPCFLATKSVTECNTSWLKVKGERVKGRLGRLSSFNLCPFPLNRKVLLLNAPMHSVTLFSLIISNLVIEMR
ncbi:MAG TPA: hypothetical protein V6D09_25070, partial [Leptolyngbyaceae cyanobacterium]